MNQDTLYRVQLSIDKGAYAGTKRYLTGFFLAIAGLELTAREKSCPLNDSFDCRTRTPECRMITQDPLGHCAHKFVDDFG